MELDQFQQLMADTYGDRDSQRGRARNRGVARRGSRRAWGGRCGRERGKSSCTSSVTCWHGWLHSPTRLVSPWKTPVERYRRVVVPVAWGRHAPVPLSAYKS